MFDGLNAIDWASFGKHIGFMCDSRDIPTWIHQLLSEDHPVREYAIDRLLGIQQHTGMIVPGTPHLLPFVLEVLALPDYPDRAYLLRKLDQVGLHMLLPIRRLSAIRLAVETYDVLTTGVTTYLKLLNDNNDETRFYCAKLLQYFQEQSLEVLDALMKRLSLESHPRVRVVIIRSMAELMIDAYLIYDKEYEVYRQVIISRITANTDIAERFAAADVTIKMNLPPLGQEVKQVIETVIQAYHLGRSDLDDSGDPLHFEPFL